MDRESQTLIDEMGAEYAAYMAEVTRRNQDFGDRAAALGTHVEYDRDEDVLSITVGEPIEASTESVDNRAFISVDPDSLKIVGIEFHGFRDFIARGVRLTERRGIDNGGDSHEGIR